MLFLSCKANVMVKHAKTGHGSTLPNFCVVCIACFVSFSVLFVCICVLYYCHRVAIQLQLTLGRLMSYIYGAPILDVSRAHTKTQHSR